MLHDRLKASVDDADTRAVNAHRFLRASGYVLVLIGVVLVAGGVVTLAGSGRDAYDVSRSGLIAIGLSYAALGVLLSFYGFAFIRRR
jgi:hypothetical protein